MNHLRILLNHLYREPMHGAYHVGTFITRIKKLPTAHTRMNNGVESTGVEYMDWHITAGVLGNLDYMVVARPTASWNNTVQLLTISATEHVTMIRLDGTTLLKWYDAMPRDLALATATP
jgi:hypothetical protein